MFTSLGTKILTLVLAFTAGYTAPVNVVDQVVDAGYSRHIVERLPADDVQSILDSVTVTPPICRPSKTVTSC
jgi:hypothetical protein